ncbi:hypothetical protein JCM11641_003275 [Rhodosporidiobolus odoratus]
MAKISVEALMGDNLRDLVILELPVPFTTTNLTPAFSLSSLILRDRAPLPDSIGECCGLYHSCCLCGSQHHAAIDCKLQRWGLPAVWIQTIRYFSPKPASDGLNFLSLLNFPYFSLPPFLAHLSIEVLKGLLEAGLAEVHPSLLQRDCQCGKCAFFSPDTISEFFDFLQITPLRQVRVNVGVHVSDRQLAALETVARRRGIKFDIGIVANGLYPAQQARLDGLVEQSIPLLC